MTYYTSGVTGGGVTSLADIEAALAKLNLLTKNSRRSFEGLRIYVNDMSFPKRRLSEAVPVSSEVRTAVNKWMLEFFGSEPLIPDGTLVQLHDGSWMCNSKTFSTLRELTYHD